MPIQSRTGDALLLRIAVPIVALAMSSGCVSQSVATLPYLPTTSIPASSPGPLVSVDPIVRNERRAGAETPTWIGTIRSGYGNPVHRLHANQPISQAIENAFRSALNARGLMAEQITSKFTLSIIIHQFDANQYARREATADLTIALTDRASGREIWRDRYRAYAVDGSRVSLRMSVFASPADLRAVALQAMNETIDTLLDRPGFRAALGA